MKNREFREIQVSSTQLAIIFLGILVIGVIIFLLGVSGGKKHAQLAGQVNVIAQKAPEQIKEKIVSLPQAAAEPGSADESVGKPVPAEPTPIKKDIIPKPVAEKPKTPTPKAKPEDQLPVELLAMAPKKGLYYVQIGALAEKQAAQETAQRFRNMGYSVLVMEPLATDKKPVFRVRVGGFTTRAQAEEVREKLSSAAGRKTDYFIVRD